MTYGLKAAGALGLIWMTTLPFGLSQANHPSSVDRRLEEEKLDITLLKRLIKDQERRITDLEKTVKTLQAALAATAEKPASAERQIVPRPPAVLWQNPLAWARIKEGMSRAQVEDILGSPASVDAVIDYQTLIYKGDVPGAGVVSGTVRLTDDRVSQVIAPAF